MDESMGREMTSSRNRNICASNEARNDKQYLFFHIISLLGHRRRLFSGVYISPHSSELDDEPTSFFSFSPSLFYTLHRLFSLSLYDIVLPSIDICIRCSLHVSWWWRRRRGFVLDDYIGPSIFFFSLYTTDMPFERSLPLISDISYRHAVVVQESKRKENLAWSEPEDI